VVYRIQQNPTTKMMVYALTENRLGRAALRREHLKKLEENSMLTYP
jgi:hypothetical protein